MLPQTITHLREHGYARGEERVDRAGLATACAALLLEQPVAAAGEIQERALIVPEIRFRLLGAVDGEDVESELDLLVGQLTSSDGPVQHKLEDGVVLCSAQVTRKLSNNGETTVTLRRAGRFVTSSPDLVADYFVAPAVERLVRQGQTLKARLELGVRRVPELEGRELAIVTKAHEQLAIALPREAQQ
jgi:hypothetical protein